ncbi:glycosyltransferase family 39 protein [Flavobacterium sp.]|uniref:glycosyltransferase family 39 protein n=1 Tax=Flavobacterium sp. TaxID=239 RepID=UPI002612FAE2|nr:glycosyltransferase family 39 protein [Flavobacterium sp.]
MIQKIKENYLLITILVFAAILRFYHIDFQSIWLDEIHTMNEANPNVGFFDLYDIIMAGEQMPPLYFYSLYFLFKIFGYTTFVARVYSAFVGVISVFSIFLLGKEIFNKKTGIFAALIITINPFHLYYSQDARPYMFLFLFTTLAFYYLIKFIKNNNQKSAILYGLASALMIYSHFFGLFVLFTQYLLMLFFIIISKTENRKKFFINSFLSGVITLILFIPAIKIFIKVTQIKEFWIPAPTLDVYTLIFKEFFGNSELVLTLIGLLIFVYFIKLFKEKDSKVSYESIIENKTIFSFIILIPWIVIVTLIPLIRSYLSIPMIISRYFITVLPAVILIIAIAFYYFKNRIFQTSILVLLVIFSITDIVVVKKYYSSINKAQFREATNFIIQNNAKKEKVVSSLGWYMPYFLKNGKVNYEIIDKPLDAFIAEMQQDSTKIKPFWYIDGFGREYKPSEATLAFISANFYIENNYDGFQAWTKHFILLKDVPMTIDISKFKELSQYNGDGFMFNVETFETVNNIVNTSGWAYFEKQVAAKTEMEIIFIKDGKANRLMTEKVIRPDVTTYFKNDFNVDNCGFKSTYDISKLESGKHQLAIYLVDKETKKEGLVLTDKYVTKP